MEELVPESGW